MGIYELIQINATMIAGILIFYTILYITAGGPYWKKEYRSEKAVLYLIAIAIGAFALSASLAFIVIIPYNLYWSYLSTICGFIAIAAAAIIFIKVIKLAKTTIKEEKQAQEASGKWEEEEWKDKTMDEIKEEEAKRKQKEELEKKKAKMEESESYHTLWPEQPTEESSDKSHVDDAIGD